ncbi:hypothetical protein BCR43DRAFT_434488 [Syncephalastrum racemosum]|uniref:Uncharacterized protein n=1 Tax=Syncephalastrum racemosum TaxID=13706 RepID=A0A1X2HND7_SYNRA|nr:hypothetical protein BCR43DRAFT_434488 [Syncephalastrum racemosum]
MNKRQLAQDADRPCYDRGNGSPFCAPTSTDTWELGSSHRFEWNYNYPFYVTAERINLYLYYKENYAYMTIKNFTDLPRADGGLDVNIDKSWFPPQLANDDCTLYGLYLPEGTNPTEELTNPLSQYPRPFNFTIHRRRFFSCDSRLKGV